MAQTDREKEIYEFGDFVLDTREHRLYRNGETLQLQPKAFGLLAFLLQNRGRLLTKDEIIREVWSDAAVEESNLAVNIHTLRKLLAHEKNFIETVPRRGYRFIGDVVVRQPDGASFEQNISNITVRQSANPTVVDGTSVINQQTIVLTDDAAAQVAQSLHSQIRTQNRTYFTVGLVLIALAGGLIGLYLWRGDSGRSVRATLGAPDPNEVTSIAVLPFRNVTNEARDDALALGITDSLITRLGAIKRLAVRPTSAVLPFAGNPSPLAVGEQLKVDHVLEGTVQRAGDRLRVSVQLVQTRANTVLWSKSFENESDDLLEIQETIALAIADALPVNVSKEEYNALARAQTTNAEAFRLYLEGRYFWNKRTGPDMEKSVELFSLAKDKDPAFVLAYVGLADAYQLLAEYRKFSTADGVTPTEAYSRSRLAYRKALELDENSAEARTSLAYAQAFFDWNWSEAEIEFKRAIAINPNYATARQWYGEYLVAVGRFDEALAELRKAEELDPTSMIIKSDIAAYFYMTRQCDQVLEETKKMIDASPSFVYAYAYRWVCFEQAGMISEAFETLATGNAYFLPPETVKLEREIFVKEGWRGFWRFRLERLNAPPYRSVVNNYLGAMTAIRAGENEAAFNLLTKSAEARERWFPNLKFDPQFDSLRGDARFGELVRTANLEP